jgi:hypothetical protein
MVDRGLTETELRAQLLGSLLLFTQTFFKLRTGREYQVSSPIGRESHHVQICRKLVQVFRGEITKLRIHVPPRYGKTELLISFVCWALAYYPDSNFLYVSYGQRLAKKQTQTIRNIAMLMQYKTLFGVNISPGSSAKDDFETTVGGSVYAAGAGGTITGRGAGIFNCDRFGGCVVIDDIHKPDEALSDVIREGTIDWYYNTMQSRLNDGERTPIIYIGQKTHEHDLAGHFDENEVGEWDTLTLPALDAADNALNPALHSTEDLHKMQQRDRYVFAAQYQQNPQPAGDELFGEADFVIHDYDPEMVCTFITVDTAETDKDYNDATVFSFFGLYKIQHTGIETELYGLHWIDCMEMRVEPNQLESEFLSFYAGCMRHKVPPKVAAIEKKSTGVTLSSVLKKMQGLRIMDLERTKASGSKAARYIEMQPYIAGNQVSFTDGAKHIEMCTEHCRKITLNNTHRFDDIADTLYDGIKLGLIDKIILVTYSDKNNNVAEISKSIADKMQQRANIRGQQEWHR